MPGKLDPNDKKAGYIWSFEKDGDTTWIPDNSNTKAIEFDEKTGAFTPKTKGIYTIKSTSKATIGNANYPTPIALNL